MAMNMKSSSCLYVFLLIIFLLLVDKSDSANFLLPLAKVISKGLWSRKTREFAFDRGLDQLKQNLLSPPQPNARLAPVKQINGLNLIKMFLSNFGYLESSGRYDDYLDGDTVSAIKAYQKYFNLQVTGQLDRDTLQLISLPRCGSPDIIFDYDFTGTNVMTWAWPKAGKQWFPKGTRNLTYGFLPRSEIPLNMANVFRSAFARWAQATTVLNLTETASYVEADIKVGFYIFNPSLVVVGDTIIRLREQSSIKTGDVRLDATKYWALPVENVRLAWEEGVFDLETVAMHQIGHLLGLDHSNNMDSVMYPVILPWKQRKVQLSVDDKDAIQQDYTKDYSAGSSGRYTIMFGSRGLLTTLSIGFGFMVLF